MSVGSIFVEMDYTSVEEHLNKLTEKGEEEMEKLKAEKETMQKELDVRMVKETRLMCRSLRPSYMPVLVIWLCWVKCNLLCLFRCYVIIPVTETSLLLRNEKSEDFHILF